MRRMDLCAHKPSFPMFAFTNQPCTLSSPKHSNEENVDLCAHKPSFPLFQVFYKGHDTGTYKVSVFRFCWCVDAFAGAEEGMSAKALQVCRKRIEKNIIGVLVVLLVQRTA